MKNNIYPFNLFDKKNLKIKLAEFNLKPTRRYGQNFLISYRPIKKIWTRLKADKSIVIIEIGPGLGVLTWPLSKRFKKIIGLEIERKLQPYWQNYTAENINIVWGNALKTIDEIKLPDKYKIVANLPYQISSAMIQKILSLKPSPKQVILMLQKEVGERIVQQEKTNLLNLSVQLFCQAKIIANVKKNNFYPQPKVDSVLLELSNFHKQYSDNDKKKIFQLLKIVFANKRKKIKNNCQNKSDLLKIFSDYLNYRAEDIDLTTWKKLLAIYLKH